jgi:hypothetical protein
MPRDPSFKLSPGVTDPLRDFANLSSEDFEPEPACTDFLEQPAPVTIITPSMTTRQAVKDRAFMGCSPLLCEMDRPLTLSHRSLLTAVGL